MRPKGGDGLSASDKAAVQVLWDEHRTRAKRGWERMQLAAKAREREGFNPKARARRLMALDGDVMAQAVAENGEEALHFDSPWWKDQVRRNPWLVDSHDRPGSPWKATSVFRGGRWWKRVDGGWVEEEPVRRDWSRAR